MLFNGGVNDPPLPGDEGIVVEAFKQWKACEEWQGVEDERSREDRKFANGDERNGFQWPTKVYQDRAGDGADGVCLTINNTRVHNDLIINSIAKNNYGVKVRPVAGKASFESAKIMQSLIRRIENISKFSTHRRRITEHQVDGGVGYTIIETRHTSERSFNQDIFLKSAEDPTAVYLDPWCKEPDGSDARFGFEFERMPRERFNQKYPKWKDQVGAAPFDSVLVPWLSDKEVVLAKYHRMRGTDDTLVAYKNDKGEDIEKLASEIKDEAGEEIYKALIDDIKEGRINGKTRKVTNNKVEWFLIAGDKIVDRGDWAGKYIPIARCVGRETVIDGTLDRKGMTRGLIGAQRMLNYSASMAVETVSSQPLASYLAPARSIEGQEQYKTLNINRFPVILWNDIDDEAPEGLQKVDPPIRQDPPKPSEGHMANMSAAERWGMMISGQFQAQMGENDTQSAASGKAISERQQQGDTATYHFPEHQSDMLRYIGMQLLDLIPKIYDSERALRVMDDKNEESWIKIVPNQGDAIQELQHEKEDIEAIKLAFNPAVGEYECVSDPGPDFATQRQEGWNAMSMMMQSNKELAVVAADLFFKLGDFEGADELQERFKREIKAQKPYLFDDAVEPQMLALQQANQKLIALNSELMTKLADLNLRIRGRDEKRNVEAFNADTKRMEARINALSKVAMTPQQKAQMEHELELADREHIYTTIQQANQADIDSQSDDEEGGSQSGGGSSNGSSNGFDPTSIGATKAPDGNHYLPDPRRPGKYLRVIH